MVDNPFSCEACSENDAVVWVYERYEADDGVGAVEEEVPLCRGCSQDVGPNHLENLYANYEFRIEPVAEAFGMSTL
jgi:predicted  nucleic acid-binding Zn-ribbon protein